MHDAQQGQDGGNEGELNHGYTDNGLSAGWLPQMR